MPVLASDPAARRRLVVAVCWAVNFVVIDIGLESFPPLLFAALRFGLIAFPAIFFVPRPDVRWPRRAFRRMNRRVSHLIAGWRTGLSRPVLILQAGDALNYFGYGLVLPFEIIYLHQIRGFSTS